MRKEKGRNDTDLGVQDTIPIQGLEKTSQFTFSGVVSDSLAKDNNHFQLGLLHSQTTPSFLSPTLPSSKILPLPSFPFSSHPPTTSTSCIVCRNYAGIPYFYKIIHVRK